MVSFLYPRIDNEARGDEQVDNDIKKIAQIIVEHSTKVKKGDTVQIIADYESKEMVLQAKIMALEIEQGAQEGNANNELTMLHSLILQKKKENKDVSGLIKDYETAKAAFDGKDYKKCLAFVRKAKTAAGVG